MDKNGGRCSHCCPGDSVVIQYSVVTVLLPTPHLVKPNYWWQVRSLLPWG